MPVLISDKETRKGSGHALAVLIVCVWGVIGLLIGNAIYELMRLIAQ